MPPQRMPDNAMPARFASQDRAAMPFQPRLMRIRSAGSVRGYHPTGVEVPGGTTNQIVPQAVVHGRVLEEGTEDEPEHKEPCRPGAEDGHPGQGGHETKQQKSPEVSPVEGRIDEEPDADHHSDKEYGNLHRPHRDS